MYTCLLVLSFLCFSHTIKSEEQCHIYSPQPNYINKDCMPLEQTCYELIKNNPIKKDTTYFAFGWVYAVNKGSTKNIFNRIDKKKINGGFTVCQCYPEKIIPAAKKIGIDTIFTPHIDKSKTYELTVIPIAHLAMNGINYDQLPEKDIFYSFIGFTSHALRRNIFHIKHPANTVIKKRRNWHFWNKAQLKKNAEEYTNVLQRSRFSLCPRGFSPSTLRFWESLAVGAIPISIADNLVLPSGFDWEQCIIFVAEKDILKIPQILAGITPEQEENMRQKCFEAYELFSGENFVRVIRKHYEKSEQKS